MMAQWPYNRLQSGLVVSEGVEVELLIGPGVVPAGGGGVRS